MKAEHVNPFIKSFIDILKSVAGIEVSIGKPFLKESPILLKDVAIIIGITSDLKGQVVISMDKDTALSVASHMMMGLPLNELDEMSKSALCEIGNMILGHSASELYEIGVIVDITPPINYIWKRNGIKFKYKKKYNNSFRILCRGILYGNFAYIQLI